MWFKAGTPRASATPVAYPGIGQSGLTLCAASSVPRGRRPFASARSRAMPSTKTSALGASRRAIATGICCRRHCRRGDRRV
eukprot:11208930-Lingulodinium_polyedra.AAC.1